MGDVSDDHVYKQVLNTQAINPAILRLLEPLRSLYFSFIVVQIYRSPASIHIGQAGDLIPLRACEGCYLTDGELSHPLHMGKMIHLPRQRKDIHIVVEEGHTLYLLWVLSLKKSTSIEKLRAQGSSVNVSIDYWRSFSYMQSGLYYIYTCFNDLSSLFLLFQNRLRTRPFLDTLW
ncbi:hypothetical protein J3F83DRAFT_599379 [Trichoderma novae-zelandiae]